MGNSGEQGGIMKKKLDKSTAEWNMFADFWKIVQEYYIPENTDDYWKKLTVEHHEFIDKYRDIPLAVDMIDAFWRDCRRKLKEE